MTLQPTELDLTARAYVYRLWDSDGGCLYIGKHLGLHPAIRVNSHRSAPWWPEVARADYIEVPDADQLDLAEKQQTYDLAPRYNDGGWARLHGAPVAAIPTADVSVKDAARELGIPAAILEGFIANGELPSYQYNPHLVTITRADLDDFRQQHYVEAE